MMAGVGAALLLGPVVYAVVWAWLREGFNAEGTASASLPHLASDLPQLLSDKTQQTSCKTQLPANKTRYWSSKTQKLYSKTHLLSGTTQPASKLPQTAALKSEVGPASVGVPPAGLLFSVLIAARDEATTLPHLLQALQAQALPPPQFEVLIADDHSTDGTAALVAAAAVASPFALRLVALPPGLTGKKAALAAAIAQARAPWVVCTDADCRPAPSWLLAYADLLQRQSNLHFISGPVRLTPGGAWFDGLLGLEFAGLVGVGGACIARGRPTMCNGANLAFRRRTFHEVGGHADNQALASGDDEFLLHKMHQRYPAGIHFLADARAVVDTPAPATWRALLRQRVRWASKFPHYRTPAPRQLALLVVGTNVSLFGGLLLALGWPALEAWVAAGWVLKLGADAWLLWPLLGLLRRRPWLWWLLPLQLLYAPYAVAVGLAGQRGAGYSWKGRQVR